MQRRPVGAEATQRQPERVRPQVREIEGRKNDEPRIIHHVAEARGALLRVQAMAASWPPTLRAALAHPSRATGSPSTTATYRSASPTKRVRPK